MRYTVTNKVELECPVESIATAIAFSARDWGANHRDAWVYGIAVGWGDALAEVAEKHGWGFSTVLRLQRLHAQFRARTHQNS